MSFSGDQARAFLDPLAGRTTTFLLEGRQDNIEFAKVLVGLLDAQGSACAVFDLDALYSSNSDVIFGSRGSQVTARSTIRVPEPGANLEEEFSALFEAEQGAIVIDSLNSLYHLISGDDGGSRSRKLAFATAGLSYFARANGRAVIVSMYRRENPSRGGTGKSISSLTDGTASVNRAGGGLSFRNERGVGWPQGRFSIRSL